MLSPVPYFEQLVDPRINRCKLHKLTDIIFLVLCAVMGGCDSWDEIEDYGNQRLDWLRRYADFAFGIPSHDTINRVFAALAPQAFQRCFLSWIEAVSVQTEGKIIAIDGKRLCRSGLNGKDAVVHLVEAWDQANSLMLAALRTADKSNEITTIPMLLELFCAQGAIITIDAMGCQKAIAAAVLEQQADYVLAVKENQPLLSENVVEAFSTGVAQCLPVESSHELGHGRIEHRSCRVMAAEDYVEGLEQWPGLRTIAEVHSRVINKKTGQQSEQRRYFISSLDADAALIAKAVRSHWSIENSLHWTLDVIFREDYSTKQAGNAAVNFALVARMALSLLKNDSKRKISLKRKRRMAARDDSYMDSFFQN